MSNKSIKKTVFIIMIVFIMGLSFVLGYFTYYITISNRAKKLMQVADLIDKYYVGVYYNEATGQYEYVNYTDEDYARILAESMTDAYSGYYSKTEFEEYMASSEGYHVGMGVSFATATCNDLVIFNTIGNSPAKKAGLKSGDKIVKIKYNDVETVFDTIEYSKRYNKYTEVMQSIPLSTPFDVYIDGKVEPIVVTRENYIASYFEYQDNEYTAVFEAEDFKLDSTTNQPKTPTLKKVAGGNTKLASDTAYIVFSQFEGNSVSEFSQLMQYMRERQKTKLIFDLRNNGGGQVAIMTEIASYLVTDANNSENVLLAKVVDKQGNTSLYYTRENNYKNYPIEIVVLANENSASASEMLIGAMISNNTLNKDHLVITKNSSGVAKTYGKGIMQSMFMPTDANFVLKLTSAILYWPNGECIHGKGVTTTDENSVADVDGTDSQLDRAITILAK